jgi:hypothetical protein
MENLSGTSLDVILKYVHDVIITAKSTEAFRA